VLAEVDYFLRDERHAMQVFMQDLARGAFTYAPPTVGQLSRAREVDRRYADLRLGLVDGSVVALAESLGIRRLATRDVRHFAAVRLRDRAFDFRMAWRRIEVDIGASREAILDFVRTSSAEDGGEAACKTCLVMSLADIAKGVLGNGEWAPAPQQWPNHPAAGKAGIALLLAFVHHRPGLPDPGR